MNPRALGKNEYVNLHAMPIDTERKYLSKLTEPVGTFIPISVMTTLPIANLNFSVQPFFLVSSNPAGGFLELIN